MNERLDNREWLYVRIALVVVALVVVADVAGWKVHDILHPRPTRLQQTVRCLTEKRGVHPVVPAGDPLADSAGKGSLKATIEGNEVTVALASSQKQAAKIEGYYLGLGGDLEGRLERRDRTVYLWRFRSSPTQRQAMYDCQY